MYDRLPINLQRIADLAGLDAAMQISLKMGGQRYLIPEKAKDSRLSIVAGEKAATQICAGMSGLHIDIPLARRALARWMALSGASRQDVLHTLRVSDRTLRRWGPELPLGSIEKPVELVLHADKRVTHTQSGMEVQLSALQARLLAAIMARHGQVATRDYLMTSLYWDRMGDEPLPKVLDVFVSKLRAGLRTICAADVILTVWGAGWRLNTKAVSLSSPDHALLLTLPPDLARRIETLAHASDCSVQALLTDTIAQSLPEREHQAWSV